MLAEGKVKSHRVLELYRMLTQGKVLKKQELAVFFSVNEKSIQRDIESIRVFLAEQAAQQGIVQRVEYDSQEKGIIL